MRMEKALEIQNLRKDYPKFSLKDVSFSLPRGYIMGLIGPNGAGKTTIIKLILNLITRKSGKILVFGLDNIADERAVRSRIGFVHDEPSFYNYLRLEKVKNIIAPFYESWDDDLFHRLCRDFELPVNKKVGSLSRGMKMKFALALAFSHNADLILMDEPTSGLDPVFRRELLDRLSLLLQDEGKSVLYSTHITSDLERRADYITYIQNGEILFSTTRDEIKDNWAIVKGGNELLGNEMKGLFLGIRRGAFGVKGLTSDAGKARQLLEGKDAVFEKASFDDIVYFLSKGNFNA